MPDRPPVRALTAPIDRTTLLPVPDISVELDEPRIDDGKVHFKARIAGPDTTIGELHVVVYDASGTERSREQIPLAASAVGEHEDSRDLKPEELGDGDFAAWVFGWAWDEKGPMEDEAKTAQQGVNFLVGRGRVYASTEAVAARDEAATIRIDNPRLEGTWIVADLVNAAAYDVPVAHRVEIFHDNDKWAVTGEELVQAGATQQVHHLLPEDLPDGTLSTLVIAQVEGSNAEVFGLPLNLERQDGVITVVP
jgi:hypothetical protein